MLTHPIYSWRVEYILADRLTGAERAGHFHISGPADLTLPAAERQLQGCPLTLWGARYVELVREPRLESV